MKQTIEVPLFGNTYKFDSNYCDMCGRWVGAPKKIVIESSIFSPFEVCGDCDRAVKDFIKRRIEKNKVNAMYRWLISDEKDTNTF